MKQTYKIKITETLERIVSVEASEVANAVEIVQENYRDCTIILDENDFKNVNFEYIQ